jgi:hypothetical protein
VEEGPLPSRTDLPTRPDTDPRLLTRRAPAQLFTAVYIILCYINYTRRAPAHPQQSLPQPRAFWRARTHTINTRTRTRAHARMHARARKHTGGGGVLAISSARWAAAARSCSSVCAAAAMSCGPGEGKGGRGRERERQRKRERERDPCSHSLPSLPNNLSSLAPSRLPLFQPRAGILSPSSLSLSLSPLTHSRTSSLPPSLPLILSFPFSLSLQLRDRHVLAVERGGWRAAGREIEVGGRKRLNRQSFRICVRERE